MAIYLLADTCQKCHTRIGAGHAAHVDYVCTSCLLESGTLHTTPKRFDAEFPLSKHTLQKKVKSPRPKAKQRPGAQVARTATAKATDCAIIYVLQMRHGVVKVGRTNNWVRRKQDYTHGFDDSIMNMCLFHIVDDFEVLEEIEEAVLTSLPHSRAKGFEWLFAEFDDVQRRVEGFMRKRGIMFEVMHDDGQFYR